MTRIGHCSLCLHSMVVRMVRLHDACGCFCRRCERIMAEACAQGEFDREVNVQIEGLLEAGIY
jgi:hypothetical protein